MVSGPWIGLATGLVVALFPLRSAAGSGPPTGAGAVLGSLAGRRLSSISRGDLKELGESLDAGQAGLVVVAVSDMGAKVRSAMKRAQKVEEKELKADQKELEADAAEAQKSLEVPVPASRSRRSSRPRTSSRASAAIVTVTRSARRGMRF